MEDKEDKEELMNKEELMTLLTRQGTSHCSCLEHCILFSLLSCHVLTGPLRDGHGLSARSARLNVLTAQNHVAVMRHSGDHWSIEVAEVVVQCPIGYRLRVTNTSAYGVAEHGLRRSYKVC